METKATEVVMFTDTLEENEMNDRFERIPKNIPIQQPMKYQNTDKEDERFRKFLYTIFNICELSGFRIEGRIVLIDKVTGKVYR